MKVLEIRVHARRRGHAKIKKINHKKVSKYRTISIKICKNKFCIKCLKTKTKNSIIEKLNVWYLCARAQDKRVFRTNYEVEGGLRSRGISTEQFIHEMNVGGLSNVETGKNQNSSERL